MWSLVCLSCVVCENKDKGDKGKWHTSCNQNCCILSMKCLKNKRCVGGRGQQGRGASLWECMTSLGIPPVIQFFSLFFSTMTADQKAIMMGKTWDINEVIRNYKLIYSLKWACPVETHTNHLLLTISNHLLNVTSSACHQYYCSEYSQKNNKDKKEQNVVFLQFCGALENYFVNKW